MLGNPTGVITWGDPSDGGNSSLVQAQLRDAPRLSIKVASSLNAGCPSLFVGF